jgi:hypothetical protein
MPFKWSWHRFFWGAVGAAALEVVRLYKVVTGAAAGILRAFTFWYFLISVLFIVLGGLFAVAWDDDHPVKCLYVGASVPIIISAWRQTPPPMPGK